MTRAYAPLPAYDPIAIGKVVLPDGEEIEVRSFVGFSWDKYLADMGVQVAARPERVSVVDISGQTASIGATPLPIGSITHGVYRISYYARITTAAGVSSSLTVEFDWPDGGVSVTHTGAAITGNTVTTFQDDVITMDVDSSGPIRYNTTYASDAAGAMAYKLVITCEKVDV